jgi:hypothetical protein
MLSAAFDISEGHLHRASGSARCSLSETCLGDHVRLTPACGSHSYGSGELRRRAVCIFHAVLSLVDRFARNLSVLSLALF